MSIPKQEFPHEGISTGSQLNKLSNQISAISPPFLSERMNAVDLMHEDYAAFAREIAPQYPEVQFPASYSAATA